MDRTTPGSFTNPPQPTRIWLDDPNPIFRRGLAASLRDPRFIVVGESTGFVPPPVLDDVDVLVFDLGEQSAGWSLSRRQRRSTRLIGLVPGGDVEASNPSQCTVLARSELTPEGFRHCLASVMAAASAAAPAAVSRPDGAWQRVRRVVGRKGALFAVAVALAAGVFAPSGKADGLGHERPQLSFAALTAAAPTAGATPEAETAPVQSPTDAAGDAAVWVNPADPAASVVFGTDRQGAVEAYDLTGRRIQRLPRPGGSVGDIDLRSGFSLGGHAVTVVGVGGRGMAFFRLDPDGRRLSDVGARRFNDVRAEAAFCLYRSAVSGRFYAFAAGGNGDLAQYELVDQGGFVDARKVREFPVGAAAGGCVADDDSARLFVSETGSGIWRYDAEPDASPLTRHQVDRTESGGHLAADVEGLALVQQPGRRGYLLASSEGDSTFALYRRGKNQEWLGQREVVDGDAADGCTDTDGIEAVAANLGPEFPAGIFVCHDGRNTVPGPAGNQNFKYVRLERIIDAGSLPA
jgi:myo-inositol-hexaphosphate 3-phosphohydrolase